MHSFFLLVVSYNKWFVLVDNEINMTFSRYTFLETFPTISSYLKQLIELSRSNFDDLFFYSVPFGSASQIYMYSKRWRTSQNFNNVFKNKIL